jgi:hypothetical protein
MLTTNIRLKIRTVTKSIHKTSKNILAFRKSECDPNIKTLFPIIETGDYIKLMKIVKDNMINIDAHNRSENTLLAHSAIIGDIKAVKFLTRDIEVNVHASCSCTNHKTALHYASENGHYDIVQILLWAKASPNEVNSMNQTALDVASKEDIKKLLILKNGVNGSNLIKESYNLQDQCLCVRE